MIGRIKWVNVVVSLMVLVSMLAMGVKATQASSAKATKKTGACAKQSKLKPKGTIKFSNWQFPDSFNPYIWGGLTTSVNARFLTNEGYYKYDAKANRTTNGGILASIPTVKNGEIKDGGKTWYFHLKKGLLWHDGQEITSKDIKFGFQVDSDKLTGPLCSGSCDIISRIDTPDKYTAVLHLKKVFADLLDNLPDFWPSKWPGLYSGSAHAAAVAFTNSTNNCENATQCPTNGPYQVSEWVNNDRIVFVPNPKYNDMTCGARLSQVIFAFYSTKPGMEAAAANGQTDTTTNYTFADLPDLKKQSGYKIVFKPAFSFEHVEFNVDPNYNGKPNPLSNEKVRQALALALDKYGLIQSALGLSRSQARQAIAWTPLVNSPGLVQPFADKNMTGQWDPIQKKYVISGTAKAVEDAKKLLSETPYAGGFSLDGFTTSGNPVRANQFSVMQADWAKLNVKFVPNFVPAGKLFGGWDQGGIGAHGSFQAIMFAYGTAPDPDFMRFLTESKFIERDRTTHPCPVCGNNSGIRDSKMDKLLNAASVTVNPQVREKDYIAAQVELNQQAYWIPLFYRPEIDTYDSHIKPFDPSSVSGPNWNIFAWQTGKG